MKPEYRVPSMKEIQAVKGTNGYTAISTFSGCGGACLGYEMEGFDVKYASEFVPEARKVYELNHPGVPVDSRDIRNVQAEDILEMTGLQPGELDVMEGSPPCASFTMSGKREKDWGKVKDYSERSQRTDDLFFEFARLVKGIQPKVFTAENVAGLVKGTAKGYFKLILRELKECGYQVEAKVLDAKYLGVPQTRGRLIFVGVRNDLNMKPEFPKPLPYTYSIRDVCPWVTNELTPGQHLLRQDWFDMAVANGHPECDEEEEWKDVDLSRSKADPNKPYSTFWIWRSLKFGKNHPKRFNLIRSHAEKPADCLIASAGITGFGGICHPSEPRKFTLPELRRISSFPDDFILTGTYKQRVERLGRAVPPVMSAAIARKVKEILDNA